MYEVMAMVKAGHSFSMAELEATLRKLAKAGDATVEKVDDQTLVLHLEEGVLEITRNADERVRLESDEIAEEFDMDCAGSSVRYETSGDDPDLELFNDFVILMEWLEATGHFAIFDPNEETAFGA
jgi:hypothetical protein